MIAAAARVCKRRRAGYAAGIGEPSVARMPEE
jgi:hypothetical protein